MKKLLGGGIVLILFVAGFVYFTRPSDPTEKIYKTLNNPAKEQILSNSTKDTKTMTVDNDGIYVITTEADDYDKIKLSENTDVPPINAKFTGIYVKKNQSFDIPSGVAVKFLPVSFDNLGENENFSLDSFGKYYIGGEIYPGNYHVTLNDNTIFKEKTYETQVQLVTSSKKEQTNQVLLDKNNYQETIQLSKGEFLTIKASSFEVILNFEKM